MTEQHVTPLFVASERGGAEVVRVLLGRGASVRCSEAQQNWNGLCAIHITALRGHAPVIKLLLEAGAPVDSVAADGSTPLHAAATEGEPGLRPPTPLSVMDGALDVLIAAGGDVSARRADGLGALEVAAQAGRTTAVSRLLAAGAELRAEGSDSDAVPALLLAVQAGHHGVVAALRRGGADADDVCLEAARQRQDSELLKLLTTTANRISD